jgi:ABC-2 type transport system permease protein
MSMHPGNSAAAALSDVVKRFGANVALDGVSLNIERGQVWIYLAAKLVTAMVFAAVVSVLLMLLGATVGKVVLELAQCTGLFILAVLGVIPFGGVGLMVESVVMGQAAPAVLNLIYLPMSFLAGLWIPLSVLPHTLVQLAPIWPAYHLERLAQYAVGAGVSSGCAALFFAVARRALRKVR